MKIVRLLALLLIAAPTYAACTGSSPTWTTTIDQASVNTCITNASSGDTINVSSGSASWTSVSIPSSKGLTLNCPSSCTITISGAGDIVINAGNTTKGSVLSGFTFTGSSGNEGGVSIVLASGPPYATAPRVYNNTFNGSGTQITTTGLGPGLIDHNTFTATGGSDEVLHIEANGTNCQPGCWNIDVTPGGSNMLFVENNHFVETNTTFACNPQGEYGAGTLVFRYNHLDFCQVDIHGAFSSFRWWEYYGNLYNALGRTWCCYTSLRGGTGVFFNNSVTGGSFNGMDIGPYGGSSDNTGTYPVTDQISMGYGGTRYSPAYIWGNGSVQNTLANQFPSMVQIGTAQIDAAHCSGLSGLAANTCNVIYSTNQPTTLLRCETAADVAAGCPISYDYIPYVYPHPLDTCPTNVFGPSTCTGNGGGSPTASLAPASLTFVSQPTGTTSGAQTIVLSNTGTAAMNISSISVTSPFGETTTCGATLAASSSCNINITFSPMIAGLISGTLRVSDDASGSPHTAPLTGQAVGIVTGFGSITIQGNVTIKP